MEKSKIIELLTAQDFKDFYFKNSKDSFCEIVNSTTCKHGSGFLEIANLDTLQKKQKEKQPHLLTRQRFYTMTFLSEGEIIETIGSTKYHFKANSLFFVCENQLHTIEQWSENVKGVFCMFDADYFLLVAKQMVKLKQFPFYQLDKKPYVILSQEQATSIAQHFDKLQNEKCAKKTANDDMLTRMFLNIILLEAERIYNKNEQEQSNLSMTRKDGLVAQFQQLIGLYFIEKRQVLDYADLLNVHPNYLNSIVKDITGVTASSIIHNQVIQEAKSRLLQSTDAISTIALELNFKDESYFGRFFKKHTNLTPLQFRKTHKL